MITEDAESDDGEPVDLLVDALFEELEDLRIKVKPFIPPQYIILGENPWNCCTKLCIDGLC